MMRGLRSGVRRLFVPAVPGATRTRNSLRAEIRAHIDERVEYLVARGASRAEAEREAAARFGDDFDEAMRALEATAVAGQRRETMREHLESIGDDIRFVLRGCRRAPAFTLGVVVTLALGLGINSAVFRVADRVLMRAPAGIAEPGALRRVTALQSNSKQSMPIESQMLSYPQARGVAESRAFARAALYSPARGLLTRDGREASAIYVDSGFFRTLGVRPLIGRFFDATEAEPGSGFALAVASYAYWKRELGEADVSRGVTVQLSNRQYRIIGVAPRDFNGVDLDPLDLFLPYGVAVLGRGSMNGVEIPWYRMTMTRAVRVVGRLPQGMSDARAAEAARVALANAASEFGATFNGVHLATLHEFRDAAGSDASRPLLARLVLVVAVVLGIACANAANLLLARGLRRRRELAVRLALGASRKRIMRLLLLESAVLGVLGGLAAALAGYWMGDALRRLVMPGARWTTSAFDDRVLLFTSLAAVVAGLTAGLAPTLQLTTPDLVSGLKDNRHQPGAQTHRTRSLLIIVQTAFSLFLVIASGLLVRSLVQLSSVDLGYDASGLVTADLPSRSMGLPGDPPDDPLAAVTLARRIARAPGLKTIALSAHAPFGSHSSMGTVTVPGRPTPEIPPGDGPWYDVVSSNFFSTLGMHLVKGRLFSDADVMGSQPVVIVNETMARYYWSGADPLRSCILGRGMCARVVGVVRDVRDFHNGDAPPPRYYYALPQQGDTARAVIVRATREAEPRLSRAIKAAVAPGQRLTLQLVDDRVADAMRPWRVATLLFAALGAIALVLSCVGVYSVMSYITAERVPELGVRLVLGATSGTIVRLVLMSGLRIVGVGLLVGIVAAALGSRLLSSLLFGVSPMDPAVYVGATISLGLMGVLATLVPAIRVARTDPAVVLRAE
jgi:predicted permease